MTKSANPTQAEPRRRPRWPLVAFLALSAFMYVSIIYKIIHYGP